jgi:hypothetical protein
MLQASPTNTTCRTRRSSRLNLDIKAEEKPPEEIFEDDDDDDDGGGLIIDEDRPSSPLASPPPPPPPQETPPVLKRRNSRKKTFLQDDSVSSSNLPDDHHEDKEGVVGVAVKKEPVEEEISPTTRTTRSGGRKAGSNSVTPPKSKTWFPGERDARPHPKKEKKETAATPMTAVVPKREPKDVDLRVFLGTDESAMARDAFAPKREATAVGGDLAAEARGRMAAVAKMAKKLRGLDRTKEER